MQEKTFISTNNSELSYLKQTKRNPSLSLSLSLSLLVKSLLISESPIQTFVNKIYTELRNDCQIIIAPIYYPILCREFQIFRKNILCFMKTSENVLF